MTIIAWDGAILAADKASTAHSVASTTTKIFRVSDGRIGFCGSPHHARQVLAWFKGTRDPSTYPANTNEDANADALFINDQQGLVMIYSGAYPLGVQIEDAFTALGSGRSFALAAMHLGQSAVEAVRVASHFDIWCGKGVDSLHREVHRAR